MEKLSKLIIELDAPNWHGYATESLWVEELGDRKFRIRNIPFYTFGLNLYDVVLAEPRGNLNYFTSVLYRGGHSTYRIITSESTAWSAFETFWRPLEDIGCKYEKARENLYAVDIPPETNIYVAYQLMEDGLRAQIWDFEEGSVGHSLST